MKRALFAIILIAAVIGGRIVWQKKHATAAEAKPAEEKPPEEGSKISHDENGRVVVKMEDEVQGNIGLLVEKPETSQLTPEVKGYGRVLDPAPLAALMQELAIDEAAYAASGREYGRLKVLAGQGNASERALQAGETTALHDQFAVQSVRERIVLTWGRDVANLTNLYAFSQSISWQDSAIVRVDLPAGETQAAPAGGARIYNLSGGSAEAGFLGGAPSVDPQIQGRGFLFLVKPNSLHLAPGAAVTGYLKVPGDLLTGVKIPSAAVVRTEGSGWVYVLGAGGDLFTRTPVPLDHPIESGWFVTTGVTTNDYVVTSGAQILLSEELKASLKPD